MRSKLQIQNMKITGFLSLVVLTLFLLISQSSQAETLHINCDNLNNNPTPSDCKIDNVEPIQDSQLANLVNDFDSINACSTDIAAGTTGVCNPPDNPFTCSITKDAAGSVTNAQCNLKTVDPTIFSISCLSISSTAADCTLTNDVSGLRSALLNPSNPVAVLLTPTQLVYADSLLNICNNTYGITTALQSDCFLIESLLADTANPQTAARYIDAITPDAASAPVDATQTSLRGIQRNIAQRMSSLRRAARMGRMAAKAGGGQQDQEKDDNKDQDENKDDSEEQGRNEFQAPPSSKLAKLGDSWVTRYQALSGGGASADMKYGQLGVFVNAMTDKGDRDNSDYQRGFSFAGAELTTGVDYRAGETGFFGMAFGLGNNATDVNQGRGSLKNRTYNLIFYGSANPSQESYVDVNLVLGGGRFEQDRRVYVTDPLNAANTIDQNYSSSFFSHQSALNLSLGYDLASGSLSFNPYVGLNIMKATSDAYEEDASNPNAVGGGMSLAMNEQSFASKTMTFGAQLSYANNHSWGVLLPQATLEWINETKGNAEQVKGHFVGDPSKQEFRLLVDDVDSVYYSLGLGMSAVYPGGNTLYGFYQTYIGYERFKYSSFNVGMRWEI